MEKLEQKLADLLRQQALANCNCPRFTVASSSKVFEAEMKKTCPVHGFRRLGHIIVTRVVPTGEDKLTWDREKNLAEKAELDRLLKEHYRRLAQVEQAEEE